MLSGYLKIDREQHYTSVLRIIAETVFWCIIIAIGAALFFGQKSFSQIFYNSFPIFVDRLWYIICYVFVFMVAPYINLLVNHLSESGYKKLILVLTVLLSIIPTFVMKDTFRVANHGYSAGWLIFMYLLGGYFKKYGFKFNPKKRYAMVVLLLSGLSIVASKFILNKFFVPGCSDLGLNIDGSILFDYYNSPLVLLNSILVFYICIKVPRIENVIFKKILYWVSSASLGIYIIHAHSFMLDYVLIERNLSWFVSSNFIITILVLLGLVFGIIFVLGICEHIRIVLFRICKIDSGLKTLGNRLDILLSIQEKK